MIKFIDKAVNFIYAHILPRVAYRLVLGRPIDPTGLKTWKNSLLEDRTSLTYLVNTLFLSSEYKNLIMNNPHSARIFMNFLHDERCKLVRSLPSGDFIVDLGGATPNNPRGALLGMGYRHAFQGLTIVDMPPGMSLEQKLACNMYDVEKTEFGEVRYVYGSMTGIDDIGLKENSVDLFWMGQSVEHIEEREFEKLLGLMMRYLKPGGYFCFDTPNRLITALQSPHQYIHPDHKIEYYFSDLVGKLKKAGFEIVQSRGIGLAVESLRQGRFLPGLMIENISVNNDPEHSYIFFFMAQKRTV